MKQIELMVDFCPLCSDDLYDHDTLPADAACCVCEITADYPLSPLALALYYSLLNEAG